MRWRTSWRQQHSRSTYCTHRPNHGPAHKARIYLFVVNYSKRRVLGQSNLQRNKDTVNLPFELFGHEKEMSPNLVKLKWKWFWFVWFAWSRRFTDFIARLLGVGGSGDADGRSVRRGAGRRTRGQVRHRRRVLQDDAPAAQSRQVSASVCVCLCVCACVRVL